MKIKPKMMIRKLFIISLLVCSTDLCFSQMTLTEKDKECDRWNLDEKIWSQATKTGYKLPLDFRGVDNWVRWTDDGISLSPNGEYFTCRYRKIIGMDKFQNDTFVIQSTSGQWCTILSLDCMNGFFSADSKQYIYQDKTSLCFLKTGSEGYHYEKNVESFATDPEKKWLAYKLTDPKSIFVLVNLTTGEEIREEGVISYSFDNIGKWLAYQLKDNQVILRKLISGKEIALPVGFKTFYFHSSGNCLVGEDNNISSKNLSLFDLQNEASHSFSSIERFQIFGKGNAALLNTEQGLEYINMEEGTREIIWMNKDTNTSIINSGFDKEGKQVVFVTKRKHEKSIWYWKPGKEKAEQIITNQTPGIRINEVLQDKVVFTNNGKYIRFDLLQSKITASVKPDIGAVKLDIWSYQDKILQTSQGKFQESPIIRPAILNLETKKIIFFKDYEKVEVVGDYVIISKNEKARFGDRYWESGYFDDSLWLFSLKTEHRQLIPNRSFSSDGRYLVYHDFKNGSNYFSYDLLTNKLVNITVKAPAGQFGIDRSKDVEAPVEKGYKNIPFILWLQANRYFMVADKFGDFWQLDPNGAKSPICITQGFCKLKNISLTYFSSLKAGSGNDTLIFKACDNKTKMNGFYRVVLGQAVYPEKLSMDSTYIYDKPGRNPNSNIWIFRKETYKDLPNYFLTSDFRTFKQITQFKCEQTYNWLTPEIVNFQHLDGVKGQGVLYKPEVFDPSKKYPVLIIFYNKFSDNTYKIPKPEYYSDAIIPGSSPNFFTDRGFLVFAIDMHLISFRFGPSASNVIEGAIKQLKQLPYVDGNHIGAAGHSYSAKLASYIYTHSCSITAIAISEGLAYANVISRALTNEDSRPELSNLENIEINFEYGNFWENKEGWLDQTTILNADKAKCPLLFYCGKKSHSEYQDQTFQLFTSLRRLEKKAWWLNYDTGLHVLDGDNAKDFTIRYIQYFDHYLKNAPAPRWMTQGLPHKLNGIESRLELDAAGSCALEGKNHCYICEAWNKQYKRTPAMFEREIKYWKLDKDLKEELDEKTKTERANLDEEGLKQQKEIVRIMKEGYKCDK